MLIYNNNNSNILLSLLLLLLLLLLYSKNTANKLYQLCWLPQQRYQNTGNQTNCWFEQTQCYFFFPCCAKWEWPNVFGAWSGAPHTSPCSTSRCAQREAQQQSAILLTNCASFDARCLCYNLQSTTNCRLKQ